MVEPLRTHDVVDVAPRSASQRTSRRGCHGYLLVVHKLYRAENSLIYVEQNNSQTNYHNRVDVTPACPRLHAPNLPDNRYAEGQEKGRLTRLFFMRTHRLPTTNIQRYQAPAWPGRKRNLTHYLRGM